MDLSKAFDTINHTILIKKLASLGFSQNSSNLIQSYLWNRKQYVEIGGTGSNMRAITTGVPQGSILGPLLFILYINDINSASDLFDFTLYADDTTLTYSPTFTLDATHTSAVINTELSKINDWFCTNKLSLNIDKTNFIIFHSVGVVPLDIKLTINKIAINQVKTFKFLGLTLNDTLTWKDHLQTISTKVSRATGVIGRLRHCLPQSILLTIYHSLIACYFNNHLLVWGNSAESLFKLQKRAIRIVGGTHYLAHSTPLFKKFKILKLPDLFNLRQLIFFHKYENLLLPNKLLKINIKKNQSFHQYNTRHHHKLSVPTHKHVFFQSSVEYSIVYFINNLCHNIRDKILTHSIEHLISLFKETTLDSYNTICETANCYSCCRS